MSSVHYRKSLTGLINLIYIWLGRAGKAPVTERAL